MPNLSEIPEVVSYPAVRRFLRNHVEMQIEDLRSVLRLPLPNHGLHGGGNFAATAILCNLISGISVVLFDIPPEYHAWRSRLSKRSRRNRGKSGRRFEALLYHYFPWEKGDNRAARISALYDLARNPLAHELGLDPNSRKRNPHVGIAKKPLTGDQIVELETSIRKPGWARPPILRRGREWRISVEGLYWALHRLLRYP